VESTRRSRSPRQPLASPVVISPVVHFEGEMDPMARSSSVVARRQFLVGLGVSTVALLAACAPIAPPAPTQAPAAPTQAPAQPASAQQAPAAASSPAAPAAASPVASGSPAASPVAAGGPAA